VNCYKPLILKYLLDVSYPAYLVLCGGGAFFESSEGIRVGGNLA
jgi:hypothetical protein